MRANKRIEPEVFVEGMDVIIKLDLGKHQELLAQTTVEKAAFVEAVDHESARKRHYYRLIGGGKFNDDSLRRSVEDIRINIRHLSDKVKLSQDKIEHHTLIVDTLAAQLEKYNKQYAACHRQLQ